MVFKYSFVALFLHIFYRHKIGRLLLGSPFAITKCKAKVRIANLNYEGVSFTVTFG